MKSFVFIMSLFMADGTGPAPYAEPVATLEECLSKVATYQSKNREANETFKFMAGCVQVSTKANPA